MAGWFLVGILLAGLITTLVPDEILARYLGGGLPSMLLMLAVGIPLYICATASTPVAAALILKGGQPRCGFSVSPGRSGHQCHVPDSTLGNPGEASHSHLSGGHLPVRRFLRTHGGSYLSRLWLAATSPFRTGC